MVKGNYIITKYVYMEAFPDFPQFHLVPFPLHLSWLFMDVEKWPFLITLVKCKLLQLVQRAKVDII